jgi:hypothetical protein
MIFGPVFQMIPSSSIIVQGGGCLLPGKTPGPTSLPRKPLNRHRHTLALGAAASPPGFRGAAANISEILHNPQQPGPPQHPGSTKTSASQASKHAECVTKNWIGTRCTPPLARELS